MVNLNPNRTEPPNMPPPTTEGWRREIKAAIRSHRTSLNYFSKISGIPLGTLDRFIKGAKLPRKYKRVFGLGKRDLFSMKVKDLLWKLQNREEAPPYGGSKP